MSELISKEIGEDLMVYAADKDELHVLNQTARLIYRLRLEGRSADEIEAAIREAYDVGDADVRTLVRESLDELKRKDLI